MKSLKKNQKNCNFSPRDPFQNSDFENFKINFCGLKAPMCGTLLRQQ